MTTTHIARCAALLLLAACGTGPDSRAPRDTMHEVDTARGAAPSVPPSPVSSSTVEPGALERTASRDLTGDGTPERLVLRATGPRFDSLAIALDIRDGRSGALLHSARWSSRDYFKYEPSGDHSDSARAAVVRRNLDQVFAGSAFVAPKTTFPGGRTETVDTAVVRYHLLERDWRRAHGVADSMPTPPDAESEIGQARTTSPALRARVDVVAAELRARPTFTLHQGGELTNTIAWSDREHAFVRVFSCC